MNSADSAALVPMKRHAGPNLLVLTLAYVAFLVASGGKISVAFQVPHDSSAAAFVAANSLPIRLGSFFELASAIPLGIFFATTVSRLRFLGIRAQNCTDIGCRIGLGGGQAPYICRRSVPPARVGAGPTRENDRQ